MPLVTGMGTTFNLPNYAGPLVELTPSSTPFLSAIGGLSGNGQGGLAATDFEFGWQGGDLRDVSTTTHVEGAPAPAATARSRTTFSNVCEIRMATVDVSWTKQATWGRKTGVNNLQQNPVRDELSDQLVRELKAIARDLEFAFLNGVYANPANNSTPRKTRGLLTAIVNNAVDMSGGSLPTVTATAGTPGKVLSTAHGLVAGDCVIFTSLTGGAPLVVGQPYYVIAPTANDFSVAKIRGGAPVAITASATAAAARRLTPLTKTAIGDLMQQVFDSGGLEDLSTATLLCNSHIKRAISAAYADDYKSDSRTVGGVAIDTIETDFGGRVGVMVSRFMPRDTLAVVSLEQCAPVWLEIPDKGYLFAQPLATVGASERAMLYGEAGIAYGNPDSHGKLTGVCFAG